MLIKPPLILDTDLLSCFCDANRMDILEKLYSSNMVILSQVIYEISVVRKFRPIFEPSIKQKHINMVDLNPLGEDGQEFVKLRHIGKLGMGEASCMAFARYNGGTVGSNNMGDVEKYCKKHNLGLMTVRPIMVEAVQKGIISLGDAENIWHIFGTKSKAKLPCTTVAGAIQFYTVGSGSKLTLHKN